MNALLRPEMIDATPGPSFFVWLRDERGFLDSYVTGGDWKHYSEAKLLELVKAAHPSRPVTWCDWAERPGDFTISGACLLVVCAGEKGTPLEPLPRAFCWACGDTHTDADVCIPRTE